MASDDASEAFRADDTLDPDLLTRTVEQLFFAYRDFTNEADAALDAHGFGRAHHRVLYFVCRHPGLAVHDLLDILKITKQSLARVLKQLRDTGFITQASGATDRRERLLYPTDDGRTLAASLTARQMKRVSAAFAASGPDAPAIVSAFLSGMVSETDRPHVQALIATGERLE